MAARRRRKPVSSANVARFPPLPRIPSPPRLGVDPRQARTVRIIGVVADAASSTMAIGTPNFVTGFHAASLDLGRLQGILGRGLAPFDMALVEQRWEEVLDWMRNVLRIWVQRYKRLKIERHREGIRVEIETQDDHGYYTYGFDVFPGVQPRKSDPALPSG